MPWLQIVMFITVIENFDSVITHKHWKYYFMRISGIFCHVFRLLPSLYLCVCLQRLSKSSNKLLSKPSAATSFVTRTVFTVDNIESRCLFVILFAGYSFLYVSALLN